ncbi:MAG TPA: TlpA disulfide reductase family protein [Polyangiaceae bacterium]|nr:TlpA disulfide reductase family protein [Polyangiaceae bacterium]
MRPPPPARALPGRTRPSAGPRRPLPPARASVALAALAALSPGACGDETKPASPAVYARNEAVRASAGSNPAPPRPAAPAAPAPPRRLCEGAPAAAGKPLPPGKLDRLEAPGAPALGDRPAGGGRWLWVNLWAAWCGPCKEEIPRLRAWEAKLAALGTPVALSFITLDDDERQARRFLEAQPATGLRASFWLPDGRARVGWLETFKVRDPPQLPMHFFFDPQGALRCQVDGAVEDADFEQVRALVARR